MKRSTDFKLDIILFGGCVSNITHCKHDTDVNAAAENTCTQSTNRFRGDLRDVDWCNLCYSISPERIPICNQRVHTTVV
jgi:hypothetical protein